MAPLFKYEWFGTDVSLVMAVLIGVAFGFFLERAGLGNSKKLVAQFYLTDMTVFKVMFTAIITAMLGLFYAHSAGWINLQLIEFTDTHLLPQLAGGLILGFGFIMGGYCPGTCLVGMTSGSRDAWYFLGGLFVGVMVFGEVSFWMGDWFNSTAMGRLSLPDVFGVPYGLVVGIIVLAALGCFYVAERIERSSTP